MTIAILLCTYNGAAYLREQLDSFIAQTHRHWCLWVSDDGSTDGTLQILEDYQRQLGQRMTVLEGPGKGFAQNFISLIRNPQISSDAYAFSDQDDIWMADKLQRSLGALDMKTAKPMLYCSRTKLIDGNGSPIGYTPLFKKRPSFRNALVQSIAGANTMLINEAARRLLSRTAVDAQVVAHDWLTYLVVSGCGGCVVYDPRPTLLYRQHGGNLIGANNGFISRLTRVRKMLGGRFRTWNEQNISLMRLFVTEFTAENQKTFAQFTQLRDGSLLHRVSALRASGLYRQTLAGTLSLHAAVILRRV